MALDMPASLSPEDARSRIRELGPWFHNMRLAGIETAPNHFLGDYPSVKWRRFSHAIPEDLTGRTVLDIGCNGGFYALEMKRRGAERVVAIDSDEQYLAQARLAAALSGLDLELRQMSVFEIPALRERFDIVLFLGVLYHLRHPLLALDLIHEHATRDLLVFQTMLRGSRAEEQIAADYEFEEREIFEAEGYPAMYFVERRYAGDPTNWWIPNAACAQAMLRSAGFDVIARPEEEVFVCRHRRPPSLDEL